MNWAGTYCHGSTSSLVNLPYQRAWFPQEGEELLAERQRKKGRDEKNRNEEILLKTLNLKFGGHLVYHPYLKQESLLPPPFQKTVENKA